MNLIQWNDKNKETSISSYTHTFWMNNFLGLTAHLHNVQQPKMEVRVSFQHPSDHNSLKHQRLIIWVFNPL